MRLQLSPSTLAGRRLASVAIAGFAAAALGACAPTGTEQLDGTAGELQDAVGRFADSAGRGETGVICRDLLTAEASKAIAGTGKCEDVVRKTLDNSDYTAITVESVLLPDGEKGTSGRVITKTSKEGKFRAINLTKVEGKWRIAGFEASAKKPATKKK